MNRKLASAYADAVLDYLETGVRQGIVYEGDLFVFRDDVELLAADRPLMWVDQHWTELLSGISAPTDPADPAFSKLWLRAQIIESLVDTDYIRELAAQFGEISPPTSGASPRTAQVPAMSAGAAGPASTSSALS